MGEVILILKYMHLNPVFFDHIVLSHSPTLLFEQ